MQGVFSPQKVEEAHLLLVHHVESHEVVDLIFYLGPELIDTLMRHESTSTVDSQADSKSATENWFPALRSQSAVTQKSVRVPLRQKASWLRCSRLFAIVSRLVAPWFL